MTPFHICRAGSRMLCILFYSRRIKPSSIEFCSIPRLLTTPGPLARLFSPSTTTPCWNFAPRWLPLRRWASECQQQEEPTRRTRQRTRVVSIMENDTTSNPQEDCHLFLLNRRMISRFSMKERCVKNRRNEEKVQCRQKTWSCSFIAHCHATNGTG